MNEIEQAINHIFEMMPENEEEAKYLSLALTALREQAERGKGCEYCLEVSLEDCKSWEIWGGKSVDIRFCPMCGRRLEEPHDKR